MGRATMAAALVAAAATACSDHATAPGDDDGTPAEWLSVETLASDGRAIVERVSYRSDGKRIMGQLCRPAGEGRFPVVVLNHGGMEGIGEDWGALDSGCANLARSGYVVAMSSYRGEDGSEGEVELCDGEAADVRAMLRVVRAGTHADPTRVLMFGASHGGCVTVRALQDGAPVTRAASWNGPTDVAELHRDAEEGAQRGGQFTSRELYAQLLAQLHAVFGGPPTGSAALYARRSTITRAADLRASRVPLLLQHGEVDDLVRVTHSCRLAEQVGGFHAYHVGRDGAVTAAPPPACAGMDIEWRRDEVPVGRWPAQRYLIVYDGQFHGGGENLGAQLIHVLDFLGVS